MNIAKNNTGLKRKLSHLHFLKVIDGIVANILIFAAFAIFVMPVIYSVSMNAAIVITLLLSAIVLMNLLDHLLNLWPSSMAMPHCVEIRQHAHSVEKVYNGTFDDLLGELYEVNLRLQSKLGNRYIFSCNHFLMPNISYLVSDFHEYCTIRGNSAIIGILEKNLSLGEKPSIENI